MYYVRQPSQPKVESWLGLAFIGRVRSSVSVTKARASPMADHVLPGSTRNGRSGALRCNLWNVGSRADSRPSVCRLALVRGRVPYRRKHSGNVFDATNAVSLKTSTSAGTSRSFWREPIGVEIFFVSANIRVDALLSAQPS